MSEQGQLIFHLDAAIEALQRATGDRNVLLDRVKATAERIDPGFITSAAAFIEQQLRDFGPASGETLTLACKVAGLVPRDDRHFGPVYMRLRRQHIIEKAGSVPRKRGHFCSGGTVWKITEGAA